MPRTRIVLAAVASTLALVLAAACTPEIEDPEADPTDTQGTSGTEEAGDPLVVDTGAGTVRGAERQGARGWLGIPYAAPPVGDLRWRPPEPAERWSDVRDATAPGPICPQFQGSGPRTAEDCLYLNVFRPASDARDLPVLVYIHGGGLRQGTSDLEAEAVVRMVERGLVVVSMNYRLGRLGYFAHPALADEARAEGEEPVANFGLLDQIAALSWVQDNIEAFGGDPDQVTIQGMSAGGASVNYLMLSPRARGLFDRAIAQSGAGGERPKPWQAAVAQGESIATDLGAPDADADELRELPASTVAQAPAQLLRNDVPIQDDVLPGPVADGFAAGAEADVPYLVGTSDRELLDPGFDSLGVPPDETRQRLVAARRSEAVAVYGSETELGQHLLSDVVFTEPARSLARSHAERAPTFRYRFSVTSPTLRAQHGGAIHGTDLYYAFGLAPPDVPNGAALADRFSECLTSFAKTGAPDCGVDWPDAGTGGLVDFTNQGPQVHQVDPWRDRLDLVAELAGRARP